MNSFNQSERILFHRVASNLLNFVFDIDSSFNLNRFCQFLSAPKTETFKQVASSTSNHNNNNGNIINNNNRVADIKLDSVVGAPVIILKTKNWSKRSNDERRTKNILMKILACRRCVWSSDFQSRMFLWFFCQILCTSFYSSTSQGGKWAVYFWATWTYVLMYNWYACSWHF